LEFEASVAGGIPILRSIKEGLATNKVSKIYGILNGTSNYILSSMDGISQIIINEAQGFSINFVADKQKDLLTKLKVELAFSKFEIFSLTQSQPSLDDVYLQATGKTLLDAEISMAGKRDLKKESKQSMR